MLSKSIRDLSQDARLRDIQVKTSSVPHYHAWHSMIWEYRINVEVDETFFSFIGFSNGWASIVWGCSRLCGSTIRVPIDMPSTCGPHTIEMRPFSQQVTRSNSRATSHTSQGPWPCILWGPLTLIQRLYHLMKSWRKFWRIVKRYLRFVMWESV